MRLLSGKFLGVGQLNTTYGSDIPLRRLLCIVVLLLVLSVSNFSFFWSLGFFMGTLDGYVDPSSWATDWIPSCLMVW